MEVGVALKFIGTDPDSGQGQSPTAFVDPVRRELVLQSWTADEATVAEVERIFYPVPGHESVVRVPERMIPVLRRAIEELEASGGSGA
jgi:hypothetical protein